MSPPVGVLAEMMSQGFITIRMTRAVPPIVRRAVQRPVGKISFGPDAATATPVPGSALGSASEFENLSQVDELPVAIPPLLFAFMTGKEGHLGGIGQLLFDFDHVRGRALWTLHMGVSAWSGRSQPSGARPQRQTMGRSA